MIGKEFKMEFPEFPTMEQLASANITLTEPPEEVHITIAQSSSTRCLQ